MQRRPVVVELEVQQHHATHLGVSWTAGMYIFTNRHRALAEETAIHPHGRRNIYLPGQCRNLLVSAVAAA